MRFPMNHWLLVAASLVLGAASAAAAPSDYTSSAYTSSDYTSSDYTTPPKSDKPVLLAKANKPQRAKKGSNRGVREKFITREATVKGKDSTNVDFDSVDIGGQRKTPMGTLINQNKADKNYDFVKIRLRWHPEMVQSASSLDAKGGS